MVKFEPVLDTSKILKYYTDSIEHYLTEYNGKLLGYLVSDEDNIYLFDTGNGMYCTPIILILDSSKSKWLFAIDEYIPEINYQSIILTLGSDGLDIAWKFKNIIDIDEFISLDSEISFSSFLKKTQ